MTFETEERVNPNIISYLNKKKKNKENDSNSSKLSVAKIITSKRHGKKEKSIIYYATSMCAIVRCNTNHTYTDSYGVHNARRV